MDFRDTPISGNRRFDVAALTALAEQRLIVFDAHTGTFDEATVLAVTENVEGNVHVTFDEPLSLGGSTGTTLTIFPGDEVEQFEDGGLVVHRLQHAEINGDIGLKYRARWRFDPASTMDEKCEDALEAVHHVMDLPHSGAHTEDEKKLLDACMGSFTKRFLTPIFPSLSHQVAEEKYGIDYATMERKMLEGPDPVKSMKISLDMMYGVKTDITPQRTRTINAWTDRGVDEFGLDRTAAHRIAMELQGGGIIRVDTEAESNFASALQVGTRRTAEVAGRQIDLALTAQLCGIFEGVRAPAGEAPGNQGEPITEDPNFSQVYNGLGGYGNMRAQGKPLGSVSGRFSSKGPNEANGPKTPAPGTGDFQITSAAETAEAFKLKTKYSLEHNPCAELAKEMRDEIDRTIIEEINNLPDIPVEEKAKRKPPMPIPELSHVAAVKVKGDFPHTCECGSPCYRGATALDCTNPDCQHG